MFKKIIVNSALAGLALAHGDHQNQKRGSVAVDGKIITSCVVKNVVALTFDDGPFIYTQEIVNSLTAAGHRATFFQNGNNWDSIYNYNSTLLSMIAGGHQIASHTWSHKDLATLTAAEITSEMTQLEVAHMAILGYFPTYMRPPFLSTNALALSTLKTLGYKIAEVDNDTQDWAEGPAGRIANSIKWYEGNLTNGYELSLNHDPYQPTAETFVPTIIQYLASKNLKSVTVGECLGDDKANWYRTSRSGTSTTPTAADLVLPVPANVNSLPAAPAGYSYTTSDDGTIFLVTDAGSKKTKRISNLACNNQCASAGRSACTYADYNTSTGQCTTGIWSCSTAAPGTSIRRSIIVGSGSTVTIPTCLTGSSSSSSAAASSSSSAARSSSSVVASSSSSASRASSSSVAAGSSSSVSRASSSSAAAGSSSSASRASSSSASGRVSSSSASSRASSSASVSRASSSSAAGRQSSSSAAGQSSVTARSSASSARSSSAAAAAPSGKISTNDKCGGTNGSCPSGSCCSVYGWCGKSADYCGSGCQSAFGTCSSSSGSGSSTAKYDAKDGTCGGSTGYTCPGSQCCSKYGYCGSSSAYCGKGCQSAFGTCS